MKRVLIYIKLKQNTFPRFSSGRPAASWTSTPDLGNLNDDTRADITTVSLTLPRRRRVPQVDTGQGTYIFLNFFIVFTLLPLCV